MKRNSQPSVVQLFNKKVKSIFNGEKKEIKLLGIISLIGIGVIVVLVLSSSTSSFKKDVAIVPKTVQNNCEYTKILNGECVDTFAAQIPALVAVMIENHPEARPQAGLAEADVVYEAMVEGNFTRFMALYPYTTEVSKVGPVRSARPYFLDWLAEYDSPLYMHVGGSPAALDLIVKRDIWDANEMFKGNSFWRATNRYAPHNVYTNTERWTKLIGAEIENKFIPWVFTTSTPTCLSNCVQSVEIPYLRPSFVTVWNYHPNINKYERWQGTVPHETESGRIYADTILIMESPVAVLDEIGRLEMKTIGEGPALVIMAGQKITGTWQKSGLFERTNFYDNTGKEIFFKPGKIWVQLVPKLSAVQITQL
ncbi:MAG: DUF3048 domain-containing protein [Candidatus Magasanikbacteria bacterium]|nr:DUF3048 domain-containing protein [Candidatus Magasanikbacteria bacterium]